MPLLSCISYASPKPAHICEEARVPEKDLAGFPVRVDARKGLAAQSASVPAGTRN